MGVGLTVDIKGDTSNLDSALNKSEGNVKGFGGALGAIGPTALVAGGAIVAGTVAIAGMTKAAAEDRDEHNKLLKAIEAAGAGTGDYVEQVDKAIESGQELAFTDSETRAGLEALVTATGDMTQANKLLTLAQDVARKSGASLEDASKAVAKAHNGNDAALRKLLPGMKKQKSATDTMAEAARLAAGQADLYANSSEGMAARGADSFAEIGESIGEVFLPILDEVMPALLPIIKEFGKLIKAILPVLIPLVKVLGTALGIVAKVLGIVVGWVVKLVTWLGKAIGQVGKFLDEINPLKNFKMPSLPFLNTASAAPAAAAPTARAGASGGAGTVINVNGAIDPEATARQIKRILGGHLVRTGAGVGP